MTWIGRRSIGATTIGAVVLTACLVSADPASAAQAPGGTPNTPLVTGPAATPNRALTLSANRTTAANHATAPGLRDDAGPSSITCTIFHSDLTLIHTGDIWGPYHVTYYRALGSTAWVECTSPISNILVQAAVAWDGVITPGIPVASPGTAVSTPSFAVDVCSGGDWQTGGAAIVTFPAGYTPQSGRIATWSAPLYVPPSECN